MARIQRIRHLQDLVGLDLNEIRTVLTAEDRLAAIRREWFEDQTPRNQAELLRECTAINAEVQATVRAKLAGLEEFLGGLEERADFLPAAGPPTRRGGGRAGYRHHRLLKPAPAPSRAADGDGPHRVPQTGLPLPHSTG